MTNQLANETELATKEIFMGTLGYWKTILSVYILGLLTSTLDYGFVSTFLSCFVGAFIFHRLETFPKGWIDSATRIFIAISWVVFLEFTEVGTQLILAVKQL